VLRRETLITQQFVVGMLYIIHWRMLNDAVKTTNAARSEKYWTGKFLGWAEAPRGKSSEDWDLKAGSPKYEAADSVVWQPISTALNFNFIIWKQRSDIQEMSCVLNTSCGVSWTHHVVCLEHIMWNLEHIMDFRLAAPNFMLSGR